jgi:hypothetical protein
VVRQPIGVQGWHQHCRHEIVEAGGRDDIFHLSTKKRIVTTAIHFIIIVQLNTSKMN